MPGSSYPSPITVNLPTLPLNVVGGQPIMTAAVTMLANGRITVVIGLKVNSPNSTLQVIRNGTPYSLYPSTLVNGGTLVAGFEYDIPFHVQSGDSINFQMAAATSIGLFQPFFSQDT